MGALSVKKMVTAKAAKQQVEIHPSSVSQWELQILMMILCRF